MLMHQLSHPVYLVKCWKAVEGSYLSFTLPSKNNWGGICCAFASILLFVQGNMRKVFFLPSS